MTTHRPTRHPHVVIMIAAGPPPRPTHSEQDPPEEDTDEPTPEEHVRHCIEKCESGYPSHVEWQTLARTHDHLSGQEKSGKLSKRGAALLASIRPVMSRYGYHGTTPTAPTRSTRK